MTAGTPPTPTTTPPRSRDRSVTIEAVILDFGGVVVDWDMRHLFRSVFDDADEMERFLTEVLTPAENLRCDLGVPLATVVDELITAHPGHTEALEAWRDRWIETIPAMIPGMDGLIAEITAAGVALLGLSNFSAETFPWCRERFRVFDRFDHIVLSGEVGRAKPDPEIYRLLCARAGIAPTAAVFVDDSVANVDAAAALGMTAIHFRDADALRDDLLRRGVLPT